MLIINSQANKTCHKIRYHQQLSQATISIYSPTTSCTSWEIFSHFPGYIPSTTSNQDDQLCQVKLRYQSTPLLLPALLGRSPLITRLQWTTIPLTLSINCFFSFPYAHWVSIVSTLYIVILHRITFLSFSNKSCWFQHPLAMLPSFIIIITTVDYHLFLPFRIPCHRQPN